jgi:cbb3-type cytochrome oxidase maturation protein
MNGLALLIPLALLRGLAGLAAFFWPLGNGQSTTWTARRFAS